MLIFLVHRRPSVSKDFKKKNVNYKLYTSLSINSVHQRHAVFHRKANLGTCTLVLGALDETPCISPRTIRGVNHPPMTLIFAFILLNDLLL